MRTKSGVKFVRVVKTPFSEYHDLTEQLAEGPQFQDVFNAVLKDWYPGGNLDAGQREDVISMALNILKAEFSMVDIGKIIPMSDDEDPQDIAFDAQHGFAFNEGAPSHKGPGLLDRNKNYFLQPKLLSLRNISHSLEVARRLGVCGGIPIEQLLRAKEHLELEHMKLLAGQKHFDHFSDPASLILSGAVIRASTKERRDDLVLNVLFCRTPEVRKRLSVLSHKAFG